MTDLLLLERAVREVWERAEPHDKIRIEAYHNIRELGSVIGIAFGAYSVALLEPGQFSTIRATYNRLISEKYNGR